MERFFAVVLDPALRFYGSLAVIALALVFAVSQGDLVWLLVIVVATVFGHAKPRTLRRFFRRLGWRRKIELPVPAVAGPVPPTPQPQLAPGPPAPSQPQPIPTPPAGGLNESENAEMNTILTLLALGVAGLCALVEFQVLAVNYVPEPIDLGKIILTWPAILGGLLSLAFVVQSLVLRARRRKNNWKRTGVDWFTTIVPAGAFAFGAFILVTRIVAQTVSGSAAFDVSEAQALVLVGFGLFHLAYDLPSLFIGEKVETAAQTGVVSPGTTAGPFNFPLEGVISIPLRPGMKLDAANMWKPAD